MQVIYNNRFFLLDPYIIRNKLYKLLLHEFVNQDKEFQI